MKIHLHSVYRAQHPARPGGFYDTLHELARRDVAGRHSLVDSPAEADVVFITEAQAHLDDWRFSTLRASEVVRKWKHKALVYCDLDHPAQLLPGLYPSVPRRWRDPMRQLSFCYLGVPTNFANDPIFEETPADLLFSFAGQLRNHPSRQALAGLNDSAGEIVDTSGQYIFRLPAEQRVLLQERYRQQVARSKFVLCPRGVGCSSYRLFETLAAGRVPVIISDQWVEPPGPDWSRCAVRVPEKQVRDLPRILREREAEAPSLMEEARAVHRRFYASDVLFNHLADCCEQIHATRASRRGRYWFRASIPRVCNYVAGLRSSTRKRVASAIRALIGRVDRAAIKVT